MLTYYRDTVILSLIVLLLIFLFSYGNTPSFSLASVNEVASEEDKINEATLYVIPRDVTAESVFIGDILTGQKLAGKETEKLAPIASLTKLFLAYFSFEQLEPGTLITISPLAVETEGNQGNLRAGESFSLRDLTRLMLSESSNDAAFAISEELNQSLRNGGDPNADLVVSFLNKRTGELGLKETFFQNTTGLDTNAGTATNFSSANDIFSFIRLTINSPIWELSRESHGLVYASNGTAHPYQHTNELTPLIPNIVGSKTGTTASAKEALVMLFEFPVGQPKVLILLGSSFHERFRDAEKILRANKFL